MSEILSWFEGLSAALTYLALFGSAMIEYVFPPFPGDTVTLVGAVLCATAGYPWLVVWAVLSAGTMLGGVLAWGAGVKARIGLEAGRGPAFLRDDTVSDRLARLEQGFSKHGAAYLAANRFVPAFRTLFFITAGLSGMPLRSVLLWGGLSAAAWNGLVIAVGMSLGTHVSEIEAFFVQYQRGALLVLAIGFGATLAVMLWKRRTSPNRMDDR